MSRRKISSVFHCRLLMLIQTLYTQLILFTSAMKEDDAGGAPPQFLSTHPSYETRLANFDEWMPEAEAAYRGPDGRRCMRIREDMKRARAQVVTKRSGKS